MDHSVGLRRGTDRRIPKRGGPWGCRWCPACGNGEEGDRGGWESSFGGNMWAGFGHGISKWEELNGGFCGEWMNDPSPNFNAT